MARTTIQGTPPLIVIWPSKAESQSFVDSRQTPQLSPDTSLRQLSCVIRTQVQYAIAVAAMTLLFFGAAQRANAQAQLADEIVLLSKGLRAQENARTNSHLGTAPGAGESRLSSAPGSGEPLLGERAEGSSRVRRDVLSAASAPAGGQAYGGGGEAILAPPRLRPADLPLYGPLEIPAQDEEGPPDGLTLDMAIEQLVNQNLDLLTKFQEIPKAQADILSAGLRGNPLVFASADDVPYGSYSQQRPGENGYGVTIIQPIDVNQKRLVRVLAAQRAKRVLEAQYQDAARLEIDNLYTAFVNVLAARETVRYLEASLVGLNEALNITEKLLQREQQSVLERDRLTIQRDSALIALDEAQASQSKVTQELAAQLNMSATEGERLSIRGSITMPIESVPSLEELVEMAQANRPDLVAYCLGVQRATADVKLAKAEATPDIFVLYTPYGFRNNAPTGGQNATSWSFGLMASVPLFNRNQGNVRRAEINVSQTQIELAAIERRIETEVRIAMKDYETARAAARRLEQNVLPRARGIRDKTFDLFKAGQADALGYLNAQREYSEVVRQYRDALIRHRRAALRLNTVVALRILP